MVLDLPVKDISEAKVFLFGPEFCFPGPPSTRSGAGVLAVYFGAPVNRRWIEREMSCQAVLARAANQVASMAKFRSLLWAKARRLENAISPKVQCSTQNGVK